MYRLFFTISLILCFNYLLSAADLPSGEIERSFIENKGQWNNRINYASLSNSLDVVIENDKIKFVIKEEKDEQVIPHLLELKVINGNLKNIKTQLNSTEYNYFYGNNPSKWIKNAQSFENLIFTNVYPGIDLKLYFDNNLPRYDFIVSKNANPNQIKIDFATNSTKEIKDNELVLNYEKEIMRNGKIFAYQMIEGARKQVSCEIVEKNGVYTFDLGKFDKNLPLIIDPLVYSTFIGGSGTDEIVSAVSLNDSEFYVAGTTDSPDLVAQLGEVVKDLQGQKDAFIGRFQVTPFGTKLLTFTVVGSAGVDICKDIDVDAVNGSVAICGSTTSQDFPVVNSFNSLFGGMTDGYIVKLSMDLTTIQTAGYVGGNATDVCNALKFEANGGIVTVGYTESKNFQLVVGIDDDVIKSGKDAFALKISRQGTNIDWASALNGNEDDIANDVDVDPSNDIHIVGSTRSTDFFIWPNRAATGGWNPKPAQYPYDRTHNGGWDAFVTKIKNGGGTVIFSTFFGGTADDLGVSVKATGNGITYFGGETKAEGANANFPVKETSYKNTVAGGIDLFYASLDVPKTAGNGGISQDINFATYIGGKSDETLKGIAKDNKLNAYVLYGATKSKEFPIVNNLNAKYTSGDDNFAISMNDAGSDAIYSTVFGGTKNDVLSSLIYDSEGNPIYVGYSTSADFKNMKNETQAKFGGMTDGFVIKDVEAELAISSPMPLSSVCQGSNLNIQWSSKDLNVEAGFVIKLTRKSDNSFSQILNTKALNGSYTWAVPKEIELADDYIISIGHNTGLNVAMTNTFSIVSPPKISAFTNVTNKTDLCPGEALHLTIDALGQNLKYQWKKDGAVIQNQTGKSLVIESVSAVNQGAYIGTVIGACEPSLNTPEVFFKVLKATSITQDIQNASAFVGQSVTFEVKGDGDKVKYQWKKDNNIIADSTRSKLVLSKLVLGDAGKYSCDVIGTCGTVSSFEAALSVDIDGAVQMGDVENSWFGLKGTIGNYEIYAREYCIANIQLLDLTGAVVSTQSNITLEQGWQGFELLENSLASGTYILMIQSDKHNFVSPIQIIE